MQNTDRMSPFGIALLSGLLFGALGFVAGVVFSSRNSSSANQQQPPSKQAGGAVAPVPGIRTDGEPKGPDRNAGKQLVSTTPEELVNYFRENSVRAKDWAKDKTFAVRGTVSQVSNNLFGGERVAVVFEAKIDRFLNPSVAFWYGEQFRKQVGNLREGQVVVCTGTFQELQFGGDLEFEGTALREEP